VTTTTFTPDYAVPPGAVLAEWLDEHSMTQADLARRAGLSAKAINQIIRGHVPLSQRTALSLESVTGVPARTWNALEALYAEDKARLDVRARLAGQVGFLSEMPVSALRRLGVLTAPARDKIATLTELLRFFGVADVAAWRATWESPRAAFRRSSAFVSTPGAVAAWLRMGELAAADERTGSFDETALRGALPRLRALTREGDPQIFVPALKQLCAAAGVVVVLVPEVTGARCSGATRWLAGRPVVQLSLRYGTDDQLWFSLFHELGHVLLHPRDEVFIDGAGSADKQTEQDGQTEQTEQAERGEKAEQAGRGDQEDQANTFAGELLIPPTDAAELPTLRTLPAIRAFAERLGIAEGIVGGRLQHDRVIGYRIGNDLKRRFRFTAPD
jgi:HTH-type transcriptional regulator / antitoxin HigA